MKKRVGLFRAIGFLLGLLLAAPGSAINLGQEKEGERLPIHITSDQMLGYQEAQKVIFIGNVVVRRGDLTMKSDRLEMTKDANENNIILASGNVKIDFGARHALSEKAEFYEAEQKIILKGHPKVWENENIIQGTEMVFYMNEDKSIIKGDKDRRVTVTFFPPEKKAQEEGKEEGKGVPSKEKTEASPDQRNPSPPAELHTPTTPRDEVEGSIRALSDEDIHVRRRAVVTLGELGDKRASDPLIRALKDPDRYLRWNAAMSLGKLGDQKAVSPLIDALKDEYDMVREEAARSLGLLGDESAVAPLTVLSQKDGSDPVRQAAFSALQHINPEGP